MIFCRGSPGPSGSSRTKPAECPPTGFEKRTIVPESLSVDPGRRILVPFVALGLDRAECCLDVVPAALVLECATQKPRDERTPPAFSDPLVQFRHESILEAYV